jgi:AcrR family transcriptional regulator
MERKPTEIRQEEIKKALLQIIDSEGLHNLSTRKLAERVGVTEGALFRHFKSKRDMILSIIDGVEDVLMKSLQSVAMSNASSSERLFKFLCVHVQYLIENKGITMLLFSEAAHSNDTELKSRMLNVLNTQKQLAKKIIQDGIVNGEWDSALQVENVATLYMGIPISLNIELVLNPLGVNTENFCKRMMCLLERALRKKNP